VQLSDITIRQKGGEKAVAAPTDEKRASYPEGTMWGILPAKGFWLNHTRNVTLRNVRVETVLPDEREAIVASDSEGLKVTE
jgi:hypothetical protein